MKPVMEEAGGMKRRFPPARRGGASRFPHRLNGTLEATKELRDALGVTREPPLLKGPSKPLNRGATISPARILFPRPEKTDP